MRRVAPNVVRSTSGERTKYLVIARPPSIVRLDSGAPSFSTPEHISRAGLQAIQEGHTSYAPWQGDPELLQAVCEFIERDAKSPYSPEEVLITHGASSGIYTAMATLLAPGDEVILLDPTYSLYAPDALIVGAVPVGVPHGDDYHIDIERVAAAVTSCTQMVLLCNPNNPTGVVYRRDELAALLEVCAERDLWLVVDEAYAKILQAGVEHVPILSFREYRDRIILLGTFSKTYAMTGWRLGYLVAPKNILQSLLGVHLSINGPICTFVQRAGVAALRGPQDCIEEFGAHYRRRGALMYRLAKEIRGLNPLKPQGGFYLYCKYEPALRAVEVRQRLWDANVAVRTGSEFGATGEGHLRLTYAVDEATIERGMALVSQVFSRLC